MLNSRRRTLRIVGLYFLSLLMLSIYWYMSNSTELNDFLVKSDRLRTDWGLEFYAILGLIQFGLLTVGIAIPFILTAFLVLKKEN
ncbi:hypothetical protein [Peijinzhouia sedimentorum]